MKDNPKGIWATWKFALTGQYVAVCVSGDYKVYGLERGYNCKFAVHSVQSTEEGEPITDTVNYVGIGTVTGKLLWVDEKVGDFFSTKGDPEWVDIVFSFIAVHLFRREGLPDPMVEAHKPN